MRQFVVTVSPVRQKTDCAIVGLHEGGGFAGAGALIDAALKGRLTRLLKSGDVRGKAGEMRMVDTDTLPCERVLVVGLGRKAKFGRKQYRKALVAALAAVAKTGAKDAVSYLGEAVEPADDYYDARLAAEALGAALYRVPAIRSSRKQPEPALKAFGFAMRESGQKAQAQRGLEHGRAIAAGAALTRDLANLPANVCTPTYLAQQAKELARNYPAVRTQVLEERDLKRLKMGSFLSVTNGTEEPAKLIVMRYAGGRAGEAPVALVGKGVTFDSGGISLKQPPGMDEMKFDMTGAASVFGTIKAAAEMGLKLNLVGIVPACENMPSGRATKPGDIVKSMSGQTIEILNTDAEGRLILCDALTYARRFKPAVVVDIATLTGACVIALGAHLSAVMSNDDELAGEITAAGQRAEDRCWHMPLAEEYHEQLKSNFADFANACGREGGAITAACFLAKFTEGLRWAHLDIAGTAYLTGTHKGSTGRPVPLLMDFLIGRA
ncbi:MAG TPA: leucyl aminopeptidase [Steroidobacteraceae bacterium]|jgi:leucyl aminopeptidase|nr:leucyl aminopeptidase [Steroidobacteraceae bacterium]